LLGLAAIGRLRPGLIDHVTVAGAAWFQEQEYGGQVERGAAALCDRGVDVRVVGHVDDVIDIIDAHDVVLHTSILPEPFGQVVVQGMARGRVVVAAGAGGPAETIEHERTGYHYVMADERSLAEIVERALCDEVRTRKIQVAARAAGRQYHPDRSADRLRSVLNAHGSPRMVLR
jgi:glycosyltransferase involved in cell wall biosynthesis